ncbi:MAG: hypothetical protein ACP5K5_03805, partial [Candidatus Micrarchaeia archaeon]
MIAMKAATPLLIIFMLAFIVQLSGAVIRGGNNGGQGTGTTAYCAADSSTYGSCYSMSLQGITTSFPSAGSGSLGSSTGQASSIPLTSSILDYNSKNNQWLITCPMTPNAMNTSEYFYTKAHSFIAGNRCLASSTPLYTTAMLSSQTYWSISSLASTSITFNIYNIGNAAVQNLAYSGEASKGGGFNISNGYDTNSYIYDGVPSANQSAIWSWYAEYANLSKFGQYINNGGFYQSQSF